MKNWIHSLPLEKQLFYSFISLTLALLLLTMGVTFYLDLSRQRDGLDNTISNTAAYIASMESVVEMLERGYPDPAVERELDSLSENISGLNVIVIYNTSGLRFYHTNRQESGESFVAGEEEAILSGSEPYITTGYGTHGTQRRAFHAIENDQGEIIGFVMTSIFTSGILALNRTLAIYFLAIFAAACVVGVLLSRGIVHLLKKGLLGHHPHELLDLYLQQGEVLNAIEDGLVATDPEGRVVFENQAAQSLFQGEPDLKGRLLQEVFPESGCLQAVKTGQPVHNRSCVIRGRQVLSSEIPIQGSEGCGGVLNVFHDKTEMRKLSDELSGTRYMLDTLRFFNHEFMNKLHIILGYLQTGETEKATSFIINSSLVSSQAIRETADCIRVSQLCALVIGKMMHAAELGIRLRVAPDSYCMPEDMLLPVEDMVTVVGNLLENAVEELSQRGGEVREIKLALYCRGDCNIIVCEDTGGGISPDVQQHMFEKGVSSKGDNRGLGLYMVKEIVQRHAGVIDIETEAGAGTCFTLTFTKEED